MDQEEDPIVHEIPVFLSHALADNLHLLQYPLRPAYMPYDGSTIKTARVKPNQQDIELDVTMETRGPHYSRSKGEQYARKAENNGGGGPFRSGLVDQQTLSSATNNSKKIDSRYVAGVLKDGELHVTPLKGVVQLRPTLRHIELSDTASGGGNTTKGTAGAQSDGDTTATESEEEEAKPVTVKFARGGTKPKIEKEPEEPWQAAIFHSMQSEAANEERRLLFSMGDDHTHSFTCSSQQYLNLVCPSETNQQSESPSGPSDVLSLTKLKTLPQEKQVSELMKKAMLLQFDRICTMLGRSRQEREAVLEDLQRCAFLVQGCWVIQSSLVVSKELRNARNYVLWCFTKSPILTRKDLPSVLKITPYQLREVLQPLAVFKAGSGWHFKQPTDTDFIGKYPVIVEMQKELWDKRHKEVVFALGIGVSPDNTSSNTQSQGGSILSGQQVIALATQKAKEKTTPSREHLLNPKTIKNEPNISSEESAEVGVTQDVLDALRPCILGIIGRGVATIDQIRSELTNQIAVLPESNILRSHCATVSDDYVFSVLTALSSEVTNVGKPHNKQVYVVKRIGDKNDQYREVILEMFENSRSVRRKQIVDEINRRYQDCESKQLTATLKEFCVGKKNGMWMISGFEQ